ncbi:lysophospholipid acyltransferase family protein [Thalassospira profundimaris]|uniref:lysophospholipid acyltransferase family protein n=1 Tax=Thalassospira profundimaris TaxID=502049 RepID=UPI00215DA69B|nr:lysophospholipid acyltransferase family protein [Thalassospira profundimaris]
MLWSVLPAPIRDKTRPVAGADYWLGSRLKRFIGTAVFNAVLIERKASLRQTNPIEKMATALDQGSNLIIFPEGTRNTTDNVLLPLKSGLFHLASSRPDIDLVPVWIENLNRVLPKGTYLPIPMICTVTFGNPIHLNPKETRQDFLKRAETALLDLHSRDGETADCPI